MSISEQKRRRSTDMVMEVDPFQDSFGRTSCGSYGGVRMLAVRSQEAQAQALPNQDYAYLRMTVDGRSLSFCVCDGVGSSYKGDFAARYLGRHLTGWLHGLSGIGAEDANTLNGEPLYSSLLEQLHAWVPTGQSALQAIALPAHAAGLVREVLEETRDTYGSEVVFVAGRIDLLPEANESASSATAANEASHLLLPRAHLLLCWMGNVTPYLFAQAHPSASSSLTLGYHADDAVRWSTARGLRGAPTLRTLTLDALQRVIIHTDGLDAIGPEIANMDDEGLQRAIRDLLAQPTSDDMTLLDIFCPDNSRNSSAPSV